MNKLDETFNKSIDFINNSKIILDNENQLKLYKYYKQALFGNNNTDAPSVFNIRSKMKWDAWTSIKDMTSEKAKEHYINLVNSLSIIK